MLVFDPSNPFPLLAPGSHAYAEAQAHSELVDRWLGFDMKRVEDELSVRTDAQGNQVLWVGLPVQTLLTPYSEIRSILQEIAPRPGQTVVDLGAGYGRMGFVIGRHHPGVKFIGYEFVSGRVREGLRCLEMWDKSLIERGLVWLEEADLGASSFAPAAAEFYFIYDFGARWAIEKSLQDLRTIARDRAITVIGRGRSSRDAIEREHPWLSQVHPPRHFPHYSIYRSSDEG